MANYTPLAQLITNDKDNLRKKIKGLSLPSDANKIKELCIDFVNKITKKDAVYMMQLSLLEQDLISPVLKVMDTLYASDIELSKKIASTLSQQKAVNAPEKKHKNERTITKEYTPALVGAAGGTLLATICKPTSWGVILMGSVISAIIGKILYGIYLDRDNNVVAQYGESQSSPKEYILTERDSDNVIKALVSSGECIDKVLLTYRRHLDILQDDFARKVSDYELEKEYIGVLECYQSLLGNLADMEQSPVVVDSIRKISQTLQKQGFKSVNYSEDACGYFNCKEEYVDHIEQFTPAIIKITDSREILVLKGDVVVPTKK